jgi:hypothetical protein
LGDGQVTFRWRDSADHNQQKLMTVSLDEFLRRFLLHLLPKGFVRIRHFGFLANRRRSTLLPLCFAALGQLRPRTEFSICSHNQHKRMLASRRTLYRLPANPSTIRQPNLTLTLA